MADDKYIRESLVRLSSQCSPSINDLRTLSKNLFRYQQIQSQFRVNRPQTLLHKVVKENACVQSGFLLL